MAEHAAASPRTYVAIFVALLALTLTTVLASRLELGRLEVPVALAIAVTKAALVVLFFMHALHSPRLTWVVIGGSLLFIAILLSLTLSDYLSRDWLGL